jgi:DNA primase large subunit
LPAGSAAPPTNPAPPECPRLASGSETSHTCTFPVSAHDATTCGCWRIERTRLTAPSCRSARCSTTGSSSRLASEPASEPASDPPPRSIPEGPGPEPEPEESSLPRRRVRYSDDSFITISRCRSARSACVPPTRKEVIGKLAGRRGD